LTSLLENSRPTVIRGLMPDEEWAIFAPLLTTGCGFPALPGWGSTHDRAKTWDYRVDAMGS